MDMLKEMMKKKKDGEKLDPQYKDAKMSVLQEIRDLASKHMGEDLKGAGHEVSVAAPDKEGLKAGLDVASHMLGSEDGSPSAEEADHMEDDGKEAEESEDSDEDHHEDKLSPEEEAMLAKLLAKKSGA